MLTNQMTLAQGLSDFRVESGYKILTFFQEHSHIGKESGEFQIVKNYVCSWIREDGLYIFGGDDGVGIEKTKYAINVVTRIQ